MSANVHVFWEGAQFAHHSLALSNRAYCSALIETGLVELTTVPSEPDEFSPGDDPALQALAAHDLRSNPAVLVKSRKSPIVWVRHQFPIRPQRPPGNAKWVIMHPWEYSVMPSAYAGILQQADEVWTASSFGRQAMIRSGIDAAKIFVIPNGVDPQVFFPDGNALPLPTAKTFRFLTVGGTIYRKGIDILLDAYRRAFTSADDVCLIVKDFGGQGIYRGQTAETLVRQFMAQPGAPEILYLPETLDRADLARLYRAGDVFVSAYRGEGFSLPTLEAMASGLPVIVTAGGATDDFVNDGVGWRIDSTPRSVGHTIYGLPLSSEGFLLEPDRAHLVALLRAAYESRDQVALKGAQAVVQAQSWTWKRAVGQILGRVDTLCSTDLQTRFGV